LEYIMARRKTQNQSNGVGDNKMEAARRVLQDTPKITAGELSRAVLEQYGLDLPPKMASTYKYNIEKSARKRGRRSGVRSDVSVAQKPPSEGAGVDDLLQAAQKLGWQRIKEVVDLVIQAPA
jgi:hypothetical protein